MFPDKPVTYLPIRALGDFIISAAIVKNKFVSKIPMVLPSYLKAFFNATDSGKDFDIVNTINYNDQPAFYELYKVKDLINLKRLIKDTKTFYTSTDNEDTYLLDYSSKRLLFAKAKLIWPNVNENIYYSKKKMFCKYFDEKNGLSNNRTISNLTPYYKILILPGSRILTKRINEKLLYEIVKEFKNSDIQIAEFGNVISKPSDVIYYYNFEKLISLINNYDLIISAESLPYHLAYYLNKPHFVIYNESKHFKRTFMTPFMLQNDYHCIFKNDRYTAVIDKLRIILN